MPDRREKLTWLLHRLLAMSPGEWAGHLRRRRYIRQDERAKTPALTRPGDCVGRYPPPRASTRNAAAIARGQWTVFRNMVLSVDDPPRWQKDYLAGRDLHTSASAFRLNHRKLPPGCDIKLIWDLNRWTHLVTLAAAGEADTVIHYLSDWAEQNPPYRGWNWTSALESGIRLVNFCWIDALLRPRQAARMDAVAVRILAPHVRYTWRYRSFGSSANNHLIGELAGLILALLRWPALSAEAVPLAQLQALWEKEVLAQFAGDGGNREQALHYHEFSLTLCQMVRDGLPHVSPEVLERLARAEDFYASLHVEGEPWDYGDSDDAELVTHFTPPKPGPGWRFFNESGYAVYRSAAWMLRWDLSPLGYLSTAAHGHLDALHLSIRHKGRPLVIDPGTGAYFADAKLRSALAGWSAHNGPHPAGLDAPRRLGPFLWSRHHPQPTLDLEQLQASLGTQQRRLEILPGDRGVIVEDNGDGAFEVHWQFAPGTRLQPAGPGAFQLDAPGLSLSILCSGGWADARVETKPCSPSFRCVMESPALRLTGRGACLTRFELK